MKRHSNYWHVDAPWGKIRLTSWGDKEAPPVFLCHGRQDTSATFEPVLELIEEKFNFVAMDMPGSSTSDPFPLGTDATPRPQKPNAIPEIVIDMPDLVTIKTIFDSSSNPAGLGEAAKNITIEIDIPADRTVETTVAPGVSAKYKESIEILTVSQLNLSENGDAASVSYNSDETPLNTEKYTDTSTNTVTENLTKSEYFSFSSYPSTFSDEDSLENSLSYDYTPIDDSQSYQTQSPRTRLQTDETADLKDDTIKKEPSLIRDQATQTDDWIASDAFIESLNLHGSSSSSQRLYRPTMMGTSQIYQPPCLNYDPDRPVTVVTYAVPSAPIVMAAPMSYPAYVAPQTYVTTQVPIAYVPTAPLAIITDYVPNIYAQPASSAAYTVSTISAGYQAAAVYPYQTSRERNPWDFGRCDELLSSRFLQSQASCLDRRSSLDSWGNYVHRSSQLADMQNGLMSDTILEPLIPLEISEHSRLSNYTSESPPTPLLTTVTQPYPIWSSPVLTPNTTFQSTSVKLMRFHFLASMEIALEHLGWDKFIFIGHSMGCELGLFYNAIYPNKMIKMIFFDAELGLRRLQVRDLVEYQKMFYDDYYDEYQKNNYYHRTYTIPQAKQALMRSRHLTEEKASIILKNNLIYVADDQFRFTWDRRLKLPAPQNYPNTYYFELFKNIPPTLLISANETLEQESKYKIGSFELINMFATLNQFKHVIVEGNHDVHLSHPERLAPLVNDFLKDNVLKSKL